MDATAGGSRTVTVATRGVIKAVFGMSVAYAVLVGVFGLVGIAAALINGEVSAPLAIAGRVPAEADAGTATLVRGTYATADVTVAGLTVPTLVIYAVAALAALASAVAAAVVVAVICSRLLGAEPFRHGLGRTVTAGGAVVAIGGLLAAGLGVLSSFMIAEQLNDPSAARPFWSMGADLDATPVAIGVVLLLIGLAFEYGERLQRDTAGLV